MSEAETILREVRSLRRLALDLHGEDFRTAKKKTRAP